MSFSSSSSAGAKMTHSLSTLSPPPLIKKQRLAPQSGVRMGVPQTHSILSPSYQARQFEYHYSCPLMAIGALTGEVIVADWERRRVVGSLALPNARTDHGPSSVLALQWLRRSPDRLLAGCSIGASAMFKVDINSMRTDDASSTTAPPSILSLHHSYPQPLTVEMTSLHCNADDTLISASGYTHSVNVLDLETGALLRRLKNIHASHINIARFANAMPYLLLTCSFDQKLHAFDLRSNASVLRSGNDSSDPESYLSSSSSTPVPIYTCATQTGCVMVTWSPNDLYFLSSGVDNEVVQWHGVDGRKDFEYSIPPEGHAANFTRSYYMNEGEAIISGSSASNLLYVCSAIDGSVLDTMDCVEGRSNDNLYIQSLRGNPMPEYHNRFSILTCYRSQPVTQGYELIEVNMNRDPRGNLREHPLSLGSIIHMANDYHQFVNQSYAADVVISCSGGMGDELIYSHQAILRARWPWFQKHAVWKNDGTTTTATTIAAPPSSSSTLPSAAAAPTAMRDLGSLDDDDPPDQPMRDTSTSPAAASSPDTLTFCQIHIPHPSSSSSSAASSYDTITISSTGMISIEFPRLPRRECLLLLEYLYTGVIPIQSTEDAAAEKAKGVDMQQKAAPSVSASSAQSLDFDDMDDAQSKLPATLATAFIDLKGLDEEDEEEQRAILASWSSSVRPHSMIRSASSGSSTVPEVLDVHAALMQLSLHATPSTASTFFTPSSTSSHNSPLSASFEAKMSIYTLASDDWYQLRRLATLMERSMRKSMSSLVVEMASPSTASALSSSAASSSSTTSFVTPRADVVSILLTRILECVHVGAYGLMTQSCDLIARAYDWLQFQHPWFLPELTRQLQQLVAGKTKAATVFLQDLEVLHASRARCLSEQQPVCIMQTSFVMVPSPTSHHPPIILYTGGMNKSVLPPIGQLNVLNTATLRHAELYCPTSSIIASSSSSSLGARQPSTNRMFEEGLSSHASVVLHDANGLPSYFAVHGGQSRVIEDRLALLDLNTFQWHDCPIENRPRPRKKHCLVHVPSMKRIYLHGGRDMHNVLGDMFFLDYSPSAMNQHHTQQHHRPSVTPESLQKCEWMNVTEWHQMKGHSQQLINPAVRYAHTCTYIPSLHSLLLFGGCSLTGVRNDVWLFSCDTNLWTCKSPNDPSQLVGTPELYATQVAQHGESKPLPRMSHAALLMSVTGMDHLAISGGITVFQEGQRLNSDLWLLNLASWTWTKVLASQSEPPLPAIDPDVDIEELNDRMTEYIQKQEAQVPSGRFDHTMCIIPDDTTQSKTSASSSSSSSASSTAATASSTSALQVQGRLALIGGSNLRVCAPFIDIFDFSTRLWSREYAHPSTQQPHTIINIEDDGCLWTDMQHRFRQTQPEAFFTPIVKQVGEQHSDMMMMDTLDSMNASSSLDSSSPLPPADIDSCIRYNLSYESALYSTPTPLPSCSYVHFLVENRILTVPKAILVSRCPAFLSQLTSNIRDPDLQQKNLIKLEDVRYIIFRCILYFCYCSDQEFTILLNKQHQWRLRYGGNETLTSTNNGNYLSAPLTRVRGLSNSSQTSSPRSTSSIPPPTSRGVKRTASTVADDLPDSVVNELSLGQLELDRTVSNGSLKKSKQNDDLAPVAQSEGLDEDEIKQSLDHPSPIVPSSSFSSSIITASSLLNSSPSLYTANPLEILVIADRFSMTSLCAVLEIGLSRQINVGVVCNFLGFAERFHLEFLKKRAVIYIVQNYEIITSEYAEEYNQLPLTTRQLVSKSLHLLAGSHRGPESRNEPNPLVRTPAANARAASQSSLSATSAAIVQQLAQVFGYQGQVDADDDDDEEEEDEDGEEEEVDFDGMIEEEFEDDEGQEEDDQQH